MIININGGQEAVVTVYSPEYTKVFANWAEGDQGHWIATNGESSFLLTPYTMQY